MKTRKNKIYIIGYSDNTSTSYLMNHLIGHGVTIDGAIFPKDQTGRNWKRLVKKVRMRGIIPAITRVAENLLLRKLQISQICKRHISNVFFVENLNSSEVQNILINGNVGLLLLTATPIIKSMIIQIDGLMILNAHTGWLPRYRGLDANLKALRDGHPLGVSVHKVTEMIDGGDVYLRECFRISHYGNILRQMDKAELQLSGKLFVEAVSLYQKGMLIPIALSENLGRYEPALTTVEKKQIIEKFKKLAQTQERAGSFGHVG